MGNRRHLNPRDYLQSHGGYHLHQRSKEGSECVCVAEDTILVLPGVRNVSTLIDTNNGITMTYMDWILSKAQFNFKLGLGSALENVLLLRVPEHDVKKGSLC